MSNNRQNIAVKKWLPVARSPRINRTEKNKKCDISRGLVAWYPSNYWSKIERF